MGKKEFIDSSLLDKAIVFAAKAHKDTERRGKGFPYIAHPLEAMAIVATMTNDQELLAAACLHDVLEDTDVTYDELKKELRITIPEDLNYSEVFTDILRDYTQDSELVSVKTSNMGSLFKLRYNVTLKDEMKQKEFIDKLRTRNGNLEISMSNPEVITNEL